jgi:hypothetical protein
MMHDWSCVCTGKGGYLKERAVGFWDRMQKEGACCGINGYTDWATRQLEIQVPESCCKVQYSMPGVPDTNHMFYLYSVLRIRDVYPGSRNRIFPTKIPHPNFFLSRIPDPQLRI